MKLTFVTSALIITIGQCNVMNSLKISDIVKGTVLPDAGKFPNEKVNKAAPVAPTKSKLGRLVDIGTIASMAAASIGTLHQALVVPDKTSANVVPDKTSVPSTPQPYVVRLSLFKLYFILIYSYPIRYFLYPKLIIILRNLRRRLFNTMVHTPSTHHPMW